MEGKFIVFLVFAAALSQSCYVSTLTISYDLSDDEVVELEKIAVNKEESRIAYFDGLNAIFDIIDELAARLICDLIVETQNLSSKVTKALDRVKHAIDLYLDSILIVVGPSYYSTVENARKATYVYIYDLSTQISSALELAQCGNYTENRAAIEYYKAVIQMDIACLNVIIYNSISNCLDESTDSDTTAVIKSAQNGSLIGLKHLSNAFSNALKYLAVAVDAGYPDKTLRSNLNELRAKALFGCKDDVEHIYSLLQTLYIYSHQSETVIVSVLYAIQYAQIVSQARYVEGNVVLFNTVEKYLNKILFEISDDGEVDFSKDDDDLQRVITLFDVGDHAVLDSFLTLHPDAAFTISSARDTIHTSNVAIDIAFYNAVRSAYTVTSGNYSETLEEIETLRHAAVDPASQYTDIFFNLIRNNKTFDEDIEAELVYLQNSTTYGAQVSTNKFLDAVLILVNATYTNEVTDEHFSAINILLVEAIYGLRYFTEGLAAAGFVVLKYINAS